MKVKITISSDDQQTAEISASYLVSVLLGRNIPTTGDPAVLQRLADEYGLAQDLARLGQKGLNFEVEIAKTIK